MVTGAGAFSDEHFVARCPVCEQAVVIPNDRYAPGYADPGLLAVLPKLTLQQRSDLLEAAQQMAASNEVVVVEPEPDPSAGEEPVQPDPEPSASPPPEYVEEPE
jgi:hypothetical protein